MSIGPIFREVAGKFDLWRSRRWRSGFKSDAIHIMLGARPSTHSHVVIGDDEDMTPMHMTMFGAWEGGEGGQARSFER